VTRNTFVFTPNHLPNVIAPFGEYPISFNLAGFDARCTLESRFRTYCGIGHPRIVPNYRSSRCPRVHRHL